MNYELAKKLKDAGFFQNESGSYYTRPDGKFIVKAYEEHDKEILGAYIPTLSELIDACGENFESLSFIIDGGMDGKEKLWWATSRDIAKHQRAGETPEEAVAKLYLALHDKN